MWRRRHRILCVSLFLQPCHIDCWTNGEAGSYPFQDDDPFVVSKSPHLFVVGSQPKFETSVIGGPKGQEIRLIAVPRFDHTGEIILVDSETLEIERVVISVFDK